MILSPSKLRLNRAQLRRIYRGEHPSLIYERKPELSPGDKRILSWSRPSAFYADGQVIRPGRQPLLILTVTKLVRTRKGMWRVMYELEDRRHRPRYLRRVPAPPDGDYTTSPVGAIDHLEVVA